MQTENRLHALDAVRAFALLSGIVLHAAMSFMPGLTAFGFPADSSQSPALQNIFYGIHVFRMTLFFFIAGFFSHLMFHRKGTAGFVRDRAKRILVPLLIGWVAFGPLVMGMVYMSLAPTVAGAPVAPPRTAFPLSHLWFLYYLLLIYAITMSSRWCVKKYFGEHRKLLDNVDAFVRAVVRSPSAPLFFATPIATCLYFTPNWIMWAGIPTPDSGLAPQLPAMIGFGTAFAFGWLLHRQSELLSIWKQRWALHLIGAIGLTVVSWWLVNQVPNPFDVDPSIKLAYVACYTLASWNWVIGLIGTALRFFSQESAARRYVADASYWMYLAHLPLVFALQMVVLKWNLHWSIKFPLIVSVATAVLLVSYHYLVRNTYIGEILSGRRYPRNMKLKDVPVQINHTDSNVVAELHSARKHYGATVALDGIDLQVHRGEVLAILGPNGAGKSTSVSLLLGLHEPDQGQAMLFGQSPHSIEARQHIGVMLQDVTLTAELAARELIELSASYYPSPMTTEEVLRSTHLTTLANRRYGKLSGGQKRQVQFAMAICGRPKLLFLDEPTVGLDVQAREAMWSTLRHLVGNGCSIVLTTHYLEEAEALADRVAVLAKGRIIALGSVEEVRALVSRKAISCITTIQPDTIREWPGVTNVFVDERRTHIAVSDAEAVTRRLLNGDNTLSELEIERAGLAEAFTELTQKVA